MHQENLAGRFCNFLIIYTICRRGRSKRKMKGVLQKNDHGFCRKNCRPYSIRRFFLLNIGLVTALFSAIFLSISVYFSSTIQNQSYIRMKEAMKMYNGQASRNFKNVSICLMDFCSENADVSGLGEMDKDAPGLYTSLIRIKKQFAASIASFSYVDGFYIYAPKKRQLCHATQFLCV